jgi:hypothetical protein
VLQVEGPDTLQHCKKGTVGFLEPQKRPGAKTDALPDGDEGA